MNKLFITAPEQRNATDPNIYFRRPESNDVYAVLSQASFKELRRKKALDEYLQQRRDSGIVLEIVK